MVQRGRLQRAAIERLAETALREARRPPGTDPIIIASDLGFELLPCWRRGDAELALTTPTRLAFIAVGDHVEHARRVRLALAKGLLLRDGLQHDREDVERLAVLLGTESRTASNVLR